MSALDYYDEASLSAAFYDVMSRAFPFEGDLEFYTGLVDAPGSTILELGCGTARVAIALAERGHEVVGVDLAQSMITRGAMKCRSLPTEVAKRISLVHGDMTKVAIDRRFDAVIVPFYGFAHLPDVHARQQAIGVIAKHLRPGGRAAIHLPRAEHLAQPLTSNDLTITYSDAGDRARIRAVERTYDATSGVFRQLMEYVLINPAGAETRRSLETLTYRTVEAAETELHAEAHGLRVTRAVAPFRGPDGEELVYVLK